METWCDFEDMWWTLGLHYYKHCRPEAWSRFIAEARLEGWL